MFLRILYSVTIIASLSLVVSCGKTPPRHIVAKLARQDAGRIAVAKDAAVISVDSGVSNPDTGMSLPPDSGVSPAPQDCSDNPNSCAPRELVSSPPTCRCLNRCEDGWDWDNRSRTCVEACESTVVPPFPSPAPCAYTTLECLFNCDSQRCQDECFDREPNQEQCFECINQNLLSCANRTGCQSAYDSIQCCRAANCPDDPIECNGACDQEEFMFEDCLSRQFERCQEQLFTCFQMEP